MITTENGNNGVTLRMTSSIEFISPLGEAINALCLYATASESCALDVQRAVVEALNNIILHGYNNQAGNDISVQWRKEHRNLRIEITDHGLSMTSLPVPVLPSYDAESGRGWWIINACVDEYNYRVVEILERERVYKPSDDSEFFEEISVKSYRNILTMIKQF